jgi:hypothetical protein
VRRLLEDGEDDWVMIDNVVGYAWEAASSNLEMDYRSAAVELLRYLLENDLMAIGELGEEGFEPWEIPLEESLRKFVNGCRAYDWHPQGALWWLALTDAGRELLGDGCSDA